MIVKHRDRQEVVIEVVIAMQFAMTEVEVYSWLQYRMYKCIFPQIAGPQVPGPQFIPTWDKQPEGMT